MSAGKGIIVVRTPVTATTFRTKKDRQAEATAVAKSVRAASYAQNRLITYAPGGIPIYATGHGKMGRGEVKFFDVNITNPVTTSPYGLFAPSAPPAGAEPAVAFTGITELNCVQQGATSYNRIGTKILMKSVRLSMNISIAGSAPTSNVARVMLIYDRQPNGAFPAFSAILSDNISGAPGFNSGINMANRARFVILRDKFLTFDQNGDQIQTVQLYVKTKLEAQFSSNAGNIGDLNTGALLLVAFATASSSGNFLQCSAITSRIRYFD